MSILTKLKKKAKFLFRKTWFYVKYNISKHTWFFIVVYGIGDLYMILSLLKEFKNQHNPKKIILGITKSHYKSMIALFPGIVDEIKILVDFDVDFCKTNRFRSGVPIILHTEFLLPVSLGSMLGYKSYNLIDLYKTMLNININSKLYPPQINNDILLKAQHSVVEQKIKQGKTVVLAPHANSIDEKIVKPEHWLELAKSLHEQGFMVTILSNDIYYENLSFIHKIQFDLDESLPFIELCGYFVSFRSGLCDLLATANCKKIIIYPKQKWFSGTVYSCSNIKEMFGVNNVTELETSTLEVKQTMDTIKMEIINGKKRIF